MIKEAKLYFCQFCQDMFWQKAHRAVVMPPADGGSPPYCLAVSVML